MYVSLYVYDTVCDCMLFYHSIHAIVRNPCSVKSVLVLYTMNSVRERERERERERVGMRRIYTVREKERGSGDEKDIHLEEKQSHKTLKLK